MSQIKLNSGKFYDFIRPTVDMISIHDIAHNLSREQRFSNCLRDDWSVLQHVLLVVELLRLSGESESMQYIALHHDDPEAYLRDVPTPLKNLLRDYQKYYSRCASVITEKFNIPNGLEELPDTVKQADRKAMLIEDVLFSPTASDWHKFSYIDFKELDTVLDGGLTQCISELNQVPRYKLKHIYLKRHVELAKQLDL